MPPKSPPKSPGIKLHKPSGRAYVRIAGRMIYTGNYSDPVAHAKGLGLLAEAAAFGGSLPPPKHTATVIEVIAAYLEHAQEYYASGVGIVRVRSALRPVAALFGHLDAVDFGPVRLDAVRQVWITGGTIGDTEIAPLCRSTLNSYVRIVQGTFKWAASRELIPPETAMALCMLSGLRQGRSKAREPRKVHPVHDADIAATLPHLPAPVAGLVMLQRHTGARSGEILGLRPRDIDTTGPVWLCRLDEHKTAHLGKARVLTFGPKAQAVLKEHMAGKLPWQAIFSPTDSIAERSERAATHRRPDQKPNVRKTDRTINEVYSVRGYGVAVARGVEKANAARRAQGLPEIGHWHPHRLRHSFATEARQHFGLDAVAAALGHSDADVTQIYAQIAECKAAEVATAIG